MKITGGTHRSRKLESPKGDLVRPTSDKVRGAVFNMLYSRGAVQDAVVIDAFCGTGALGLEALSQGAKFCNFFDKSKDSIALCRRNVQSLKEEYRCHVVFQDVTKVKERPNDVEPATLIFLDPPYKKELSTRAIQSLFDGHWLAPEAIFLIEAAQDENIICSLLEVLSEKKYGDTKIIIGRLKI